MKALKRERNMLNGRTDSTNGPEANEQNVFDWTVCCQWHPEHRNACRSSLTEFISTTTTSPVRRLQDVLGSLRSINLHLVSAMGVGATLAYRVHSKSLGVPATALPDPPTTRL